MVGRLITAAALVVSSSIMAVYGVAGRSRLSGRVLFSVSSSHGVHTDDFLIVACWATCLFIAGMIALRRD